MKVNANVIGAAIGAVAGGTAGFFVGKTIGSILAGNVEVSPNCTALNDIDAADSQISNDSDDDANAVTE